MKNTFLTDKCSISESTLSSVSTRLNDKHRKEFAESSISEGAIERLGHFSGNKQQVDAALQRSDLNGGLVFSYANLDGSSMLTNDGKPFYRVKTLESDRIQAEERGEKLGKYLTRKDEGCRPYFSRLLKAKDFASTSTPLDITEGEKKADCLASQGIAVVGLAGIDSWQDHSPRPGEIEVGLEAVRAALETVQQLDESKRNLELPNAQAAVEAWEKAQKDGELPQSRPLPELDAINTVDRRVNIVFDSDLVFKVAVQKSLVRLAKHLQFGRKAIPHAVVLPTELDDGKNGADDFIARHGIEAYHLLRNLAPQALIKEGKSFGLNPEILEPNETYKAVMLWSLLKNEWAYRPRVGFYHWTGVQWQQENDELLMIYVHQIMDVHRWQKRNASAMKAITDQIRTRLTVPERFWNPGYLLVMANGTFNADDNLFVGSHRKEDYCTMVLPFDWQPVAKCDRWEQFLNEATGNDQEVIQVLRAFIRWTLEPKKNQKFSIEKSLELFGDKGTGKSTFLEILQALVGEENVGSADIDVFSSPEKLAQLIDKRLACATDINGFMPNVGEFNRVVSNERVTVRNLYQAAQTLRLNVVIARAYNAHVSVPGGSDGLDRRLLVIKFDVKPRRKDGKLLGKLQVELPGIFQWAWSMSMEEAERILQNSGQVKAIQEASIERFVADNPEYEFLLNVFPNGNDMVAGASLYESFKDWCLRNGRKPSNNNNFGSRIEKYGCVRSRTRNGSFWSVPLMEDFDIASFMGIVDCCSTGDTTGDTTETLIGQDCCSGDTTSPKNTSTDSKKKLEVGRETENSYIEVSSERSGVTAATTMQGKGFGVSHTAATSAATAVTADGNGNGKTELTQADEEAIEFLSTDYDTVPDLADVAVSKLIKDRNRAISHFADRLRPLGKDDVDEAAGIITEMKPYSHDVRKSVWDLMKFRNDARSAMKKALRKYPELKIS